MCGDSWKNSGSDTDAWSYCGGGNKSPSRGVWRLEAVVAMERSSTDMWSYVMLARTQMCGAMGNGGSGVARIWVCRAVAGPGGSNMDVWS